MVLILEETDYDAWLACAVEDARMFFKQYHGPLEAFASRLPPRAPSSSSVRTIRPPSPQIDDLFG
ncbi:MAG: hypothetical protein H0W40_10855 [Methylibium sp.]|uniref:hypothetical protein n=1 Tax=Methylibium sp. TaxID=2067992 RepID=UPI0018522E0C|nr:hypothetical protein [Methylibium sp.]MBA3597858.1 hypothetical protein [Methylibium sp.]